MSNKLAIVGIPVSGQIAPEVMMSFLALTAQAQYPAQYVMKVECYVHSARNKIVQKALDCGATHVMFIDADMIFDPKGLDRLISHNKDIVGGLYFRRQPPNWPNIAQREGNKLVTPETWPKDKMFKVYGLATGFMLIKTEVFRKIPKPWFFYGYEDVFGSELSDDYYFCHKAHEAGFDVWCDPTIAVGHHGTYTYTVRDFEAYQEVRHRTKTEEGVRE